MKFDETVQQYLQESEQFGPPYILHKRNDILYFKDPAYTMLHREDGPAIIAGNGDLSWFLNGKQHREDGPAFIRKDGKLKGWFKHGQLHREDGPAVIRANGDNSWYLNGDNYTEQEFNEIKKRIDIKKEIQGHKNNRIDPGMLEDYL